MLSCNCCCHGWLLRHAAPVHVCLCQESKLCSATGWTLGCFTWQQLRPRPLHLLVVHELAMCLWPINILDQAARDLRKRQHL